MMYKLLYYLKVSRKDLHCSHWFDLGILHFLPHFLRLCEFQQPLMAHYLLGHFLFFKIQNEQLLPLFEVKNQALFKHKVNEYYSWFIIKCVILNNDIKLSINFTLTLIFKICRSLWSGKKTQRKAKKKTTLKKTFNMRL